MVENFLNLRRKQISRYRNPRAFQTRWIQTFTPRLLIIKIVKIKERLLKAAKEKQWTYKGIPIKQWVDFSAETAGQKGVTYFQSTEREKPATYYTLPKKIII